MNWASWFPTVFENIEDLNLNSIYWIPAREFRYLFKGTVIVIFSDSSVEEEQTFNLLFDLESRRYRHFSRLKTITISSHYFYRRNPQFTFIKTPQFESNEFSKDDYGYIIHSYPSKQCDVVNWTSRLGSPKSHWKLRLQSLSFGKFNKCVKQWKKYRYFFRIWLEMEVYHED